MKKIVITFSPEGEPKIEGFGFQGKECIEKLKPFEESLGTISDQHHKPEYYQQSTAKNQVKQ